MVQPVFHLQLIGISNLQFFMCQSNQEVNCRKTTDKNSLYKKCREKLKWPQLFFFCDELMISWFQWLAESILFRSKEEINKTKLFSGSICQIY